MEPVTSTQEFGIEEPGTRKFGFAALRRWFSDGSIMEQLGKSFNLFAVIGLLVGGIATVGVIRIQERSTILGELTDIAFLTSSMNSNVSLAKDNMGAYRARGYKRETIELSISNAQTALEMNHELRASAVAIDESYVAQIDQIETGLQYIVTILEEVRDAPIDLVEQEAFLGPRYNDIDATIAQIVALRDDAASEVEAYASAGMSEIKLLIAVLIAAIVLAIAVILMVKRAVAQRIVAPISEISDVSGRIAKGETELEIPETERADEIGDLAQALTVLRQVQREASDQATRELERERELQKERDAQRLEHTNMLKTLADQFEETVGDVAREVASSSEQMHQAASALATSVDGASSAVMDANSSLKEASNGITGAAAATDEFALSIGEVNRQASESSERARNASTAVDEADQAITQLTNSANKISQIVEVIAGIARRTNLLALNASIEAARSTTEGRGFAVVASEVKDLAMQTASATEEVENLIREMQTATQQSTSVLGSISDEVRNLETTSISIAAAVDQQAVAAQDLSRSIDLAASNTKTVSQTIDDVSEVSLTSGATASQVLSSSQNLSKQSDRLRTQVANFLEKVRAA